MRIFLLPSKPIGKLHELPTKPGVYYVTAFWVLFYVGQATNLRKRWAGKKHQRYNQFGILAPFGRIHYKTLPAHKLNIYEKSEILKLKPYWNASTVPDFYALVGFFFAVWLRVIFYAAFVILAIALVIYVIWFT